jgi:type II secretory pathway component PulC
MEPFAGGGLKITSLPVGSFGEERGLRTGDVLRSVNGQQIESPAKLNEVFRNLSKNTQALNIVVDRAGKMYTLSYSIPRTR